MHLVWNSWKICIFSFSHSLQKHFFKLLPFQMAFWECAYTSQHIFQLEFKFWCILNVFQHFLWTEMKKSSNNKYRWTLKNVMKLCKWNPLLWQPERMKNRIRWGRELLLLVEKSMQRDQRTILFKKQIPKQLLSTWLASLSGIFKVAQH